MVVPRFPPDDAIPCHAVAKPDPADVPVALAHVADASSLQVALELDRPRLSTQVSSARSSNTPTFELLAARRYGTLNTPGGKAFQTLQLNVTFEITNTLGQNDGGILIQVAI